VAPDATFSVVICTRNRPERLAATLDALEAQDGPSFEVLVVDQGDEPDPALDRREAQGRLRVVRGSGRGLSRARNAGWPLVERDWVAFVDDDCVVQSGWARALQAALDRHPGAAFLTGDVADRGSEGKDGLLVSAFPVESETVRSGPGVWPFDIGLGVFMVVRRDWIDRLGGWDERLGAGVVDLPASEDMDFNHRLLRAGGVAVAVPEVRVVHEQWRDRDELPGLFEGYATGWAGFTAKLLRTGDARSAVRLWGQALFALSKMYLSAARRRSRLRLRVALALTRGHARGTIRGLRRAW
jgi:GT2 family glycosyltransferase